MNKETAATQQNTFEDITRQLTVSQERNQELELELKENLQRLETAHGQEEKLRQSNADLEKAVGELKCELMAKTVELQYKDKKLEEIIQQWENSKNAAVIKQIEVVGFPRFQSLTVQYNISNVSKGRNRSSRSRCTEI